MKGKIMQAYHLAQREAKSPAALRPTGQSSSPQNQEEYIIDLRQVVKTYETPSGPFTALQDINLPIRSGQFVAIVGKSGSGKTTLLNLLAGIDRPTSGAISVGGTQVDALSESELAEWRGRTIGLVFQFFQLLPTLTIAENVMLPMDFVEVIPASERRPKALELLERVGIRDQADKLPPPSPADSSSGQPSLGRWQTILRS
jgi:putative ABC transport system ATP-binding protein